MTNVLRVVGSIFNRIFVTGGTYGSVFYRLINNITSSPYLIIGITLTIIGFGISILKRIIHS